MKINNMIGVFDSGFGGLTVLKEFFKAMPEYDYAYLGDNARAPYGDDSDEIIYDYTRQAVDFLFKQGCELIIIACHTASAKALRRLQQEHLVKIWPEKKILGMTVPLVEEAVKLSRFKRIGVMGTRATIESGVYHKELNKLRSDLQISDQACGLLAPIIEEGWSQSLAARIILKKYLRPLKDKKVDALILACTHYPLMVKQIKAIMGRNVKIIDPARITAEKLRQYLLNHKEIDYKIGKNSKRQFFTTGSEIRFKNSGQKYLGEKMAEVQRINL